MARYFIGVLLLFVNLQVAAVEQVKVLGLFEKKVIVKIDGKQRVIKQGKTSPEGVRLVRATSKQAVLAWDGKEHVMGLGLDLHTNLIPPDVASITLSKDSTGMYRTEVFINGTPIQSLIDTGATKVALSSRHAKKIGISYRHGNKVMVSTAAGNVPAYQVELSEMRIGTIKVTQVEAMVLDGAFPEDVLIGMSFLGRLQTRDTGNSLVIEKKY